MFYSKSFAVRWLLLLMCVFVGAKMASSLEPMMIDAKYGQGYTYTINKNVSYIFTYPEYEDSDDSEPPRVIIGSADANNSFPILISAMHGENILSWRLPLHPKSNHHKQSDDYQNTSRTLCSDMDQSGSKNMAVSVSISTSSSIDLNFWLQVIQQKNFDVKLNDVREFDITPSAPMYFLFKFNETIDSVVLEVNSTDDKCMTLSIQNKTCPVYDMEETVEYRGYWQTITKKGGIMLMRKHYRNGLFIVFNVHADDSKCDKSSLDTDVILLGQGNIMDELNIIGEPDFFAGATPSRKKHITFRLKKTVGTKGYLAATLSVLGLFLAIYIATGILLVLFKRIPKKKSNGSSLHVSVPVPGVEESEFMSGSVNGPPTGRDQTDRMVMPCSADTLCLKKNLNLNDLARQHPRKLQIRSELYFWNLITVAVFYSLPVVQLVYTNQKVLNKSGNQDLCYYNFLCSHRFLDISDFNHVFTNVSYLLYGILFMFLTRRRENASDLLSEKGIPNHFGLFYAMGTALIMEGILSACYHVCPNHSNIQFDTSFMYAIAMLCVLKIYQARHPDINASAYTAYFVFAFIIVIGMYGILKASKVFYVVFNLLHIFTCCFLSLKVYYMGHAKLGLQACKRSLVNFSSNPLAVSTYYKPMFPHRMKLIVVGNVFNWALAALLWRGQQGENFSFYLLIIFLGNLGFYLVYYILMKIASGEKILWPTLLLILASIVSWAASAWFFYHRSNSLRRTPAQSRTLNTPCSILDFYDNHDIWHLLSATSIFLSYLVLLTLDDDLENTERSRIAVF